MTVKKKKKLIPLANSMAAVYGQKEWSKQWHLFSLFRHWPEVVGEVFASHSMPAYFRRDELWVYVHEPIWMQQMQLCKPELMTKVNAFFKGLPVIDDLRWGLQPKGLIDVPLEKYMSPPINVDPVEEKKFRQMVENIANPDARKALCNLWLRLTTKHGGK